MVMSSRPGLENPVAADHKMPADPGRTQHTPGPLVDMPTPTIIGQSGERVGSGPHSSESTVNSTPAAPSGGSGWTSHENPTASQTSPEREWQPSGPQPASHGHSGSHPALRR